MTECVSCSGLAQENPIVAGMLTELCVTELEDAASDTEAMRSVPQPVVQESSHPYTDDVTLTGVVKIPGEQHRVRILRKGPQITINQCFFVLFFQLGSSAFIHIIVILNLFGWYDLNRYLFGTRAQIFW